MSADGEERPVGACCRPARGPHGGVPGVGGVQHPPGAVAAHLGRPRAACPRAGPAVPRRAAHHHRRVRDRRLRAALQRHPPRQSAEPTATCGCTGRSRPASSRSRSPTAAARPRRARRREPSGRPRAAACASCAASPTSGASPRTATAAPCGPPSAGRRAAAAADAGPAPQPLHAADACPRALGFAPWVRHLAAASPAPAADQSSRSRVEPAPFVARPFEGLPGETDWVAMREILPAATATVRFAQGQGSRGCARGGDRGHRPPARVAGPAPRRRHGLRRHAVGLGLRRRQPRPGAVAARRGLAEQGTPVTDLAPATADTPRLQDILDTKAAFEVTVHEGFDFWVGDSELDAEGKASLERANESVIPTTKMAALPSAYWCRIGERTHIRLVLPRRRGRGHRRAGPPARRGRERARRGRPGCSGRSAPAACSCRSGTSTPRRTPRLRGRGRRVRHAVCRGGRRPPRRSRRGAPGPVGAAQPPGHPALTAAP